MVPEERPMPVLRESSASISSFGNAMQKRLPLKQPYEQSLKSHMVKLKGRIEKKIIKYSKQNNTEKIRKYQREMWAINGMLEHNYEF